MQLTDRQRYFLQEFRFWLKKQSLDLMLVGYRIDNLIAMVDGVLLNGEYESNKRKVLNDIVKGCRKWKGPVVYDPKTHEPYRVYTAGPPFFNSFKLQTYELRNG
jgi:hypothetical protein